jgi:hypothetical protein
MIFCGHHQDFCLYVLCHLDFCLSSAVHYNLPLHVEDIPLWLCDFNNNWSKENNKALKTLKSSKLQASSQHKQQQH